MKILDRLEWNDYMTDKDADTFRTLYILQQQFTTIDTDGVDTSRITLWWCLCY